MRKKSEIIAEVICPACDGTGVEKVKQPTKPGHKIYPPTCTVCLGKGRIAKPQP
jgi:DnaJ-class molecular chaperone